MNIQLYNTKKNANMEIIKNWKEEVKMHILTINNFLEKTKHLHKEYSENKSNKSEVGFNVFIITSDFYYRENFHSDIIKAFLDPKEKHNENSKYLHTFIELLNKVNNQSKIQKTDFKNSIVKREHHNIDLLITDTLSKKAIIIESKINNAVDRPRQLPEYAEIIKKEFEIVAIVYLTLNSSKTLDKSKWSDEEKNEINPILIPITAYEIDSSKPNLYNDWIVPSIIKSDNIDSSFLLRQYGNLIKYLNTNAMDTVTLEKFYNLSKDNDNLNTAISIKNMLYDLPAFLAIRIEEKYKEHYYPFTKIFIHQQTHTIFQGFELDKIQFKISILCNIDGYDVDFWAPGDSEYDIVQGIKEKVKSLDGFELHTDKKNNIRKHFNIFGEELLFQFINQFLKELEKMKNNTE